MSNHDSTAPDDFRLTPPAPSREEERKAKRQAKDRARYAANREEFCAKMRTARAVNPEKARSINRASYAVNREKIRAQQSEYNETNKDRIRAQQAEWRAANREYLKKRAKAYYEANKEKIAVRSKPFQRIRRLAREYGLTVAQFELMLDAQDQRCPVCKTLFNPALHAFQPCIDHCHSTGKVRKVLCRLCNTAIGQMRDNPKLLRAAARYLESFKDA